MELEILYDDDFQPPKLEEMDDYDIDYDEFFSYFVEFELDTLVWPTIDGLLDIQEVVDYYLVVGNMQLPQGRVELKDRLYYPDYINMLNVMHLKTPFAIAKETKSVFEYHIDLNFNYFYQKVQFFVGNGIEKPKEAGLILNYTKTVDTLKPGEYEVRVNLRTPYEVLPEIDVTGKLEIDENIYKGNVSSRTSRTFLSLAGAVEADKNFLQTTVGVVLNTKELPNYSCRAHFMKDFSDVDNALEIHFEVIDDDIVNKLEIDTAWYTAETHIINAKGSFKTTILPLKIATTDISLTNGPNPELIFDLSLENREGARIDYGARAHKKKDVFVVKMWTPMKNYRNISMHGSLIPSPRKPNEYQVSGQLYRNMVVYGLTGFIRMDGRWPEETRIRVQPTTGGRDGVIEFTVTEPLDKRKGINFQFSAIEDGNMCQVSGGFTMNENTGYDFSALVESTEPEISRINVNGKLQPQEVGHFIAELSLTTPWKQLGMESVKLFSDVNMRKAGGKVEASYNIGNYVGRGGGSWSWIFGENMQLALESYMQRPNAAARIAHVSAKYLNPARSFQRLDAGGRLNLDEKWNLELNTTVNYRSADDFQAGLITHLPSPVGDTHQVTARYRGNLLSKQGLEPNVFAEAKYQSKEAKRKLLSRVSYRNVTDLQGLGRIEWGQEDNLDVIEGDFQVLRKPEVRREFYAKLITPEYKLQNTFFMKGNYDLLKDQYHNFICAIDYPASRRVADLDVAFQSLNNMQGYINSTTPFLNVTWLKADFNFSTTGGESYRYVRGTWPSDTAYFKLHSIYTSKQFDQNLRGTIELEVPLENRHRTDIKYELNQATSTDKGALQIQHNNNQVLNGIYKRVLEREPIYKERTDITLENEMRPIGIIYQNSRPGNLATDIKHIELFELRRSDQFNLTGELHATYKDNKQEYKIVAIHPNRTVVLNIDYEDVDEHVVKQSSKLELSDTAWFGYSVQIGNYSSFSNDSQNFVFEVSYPQRTLSTEGWYYLTKNKFNSDIAFKWTIDSDEQKQKVLLTNLLWQAEPLEKNDRDHQTVVFTIGHPSLEKNVTFKGSFYRGLIELLNANLVIDYSDDKNHLIELGALLKDRYYELGHTNYTLKAFARHAASEVNLNFNGTIAAMPSYYKTESHAVYDNGFYHKKHSSFLALLDMNKKEIEYQRDSPYKSVRFWAIPIVNYPFYGLNATLWDTPETYNTGYMYVDFVHKFIRGEVNFTDDASQNMQIVGHVPDARNGYLDVWRNYEEIRIVDVSSYLKMNHSRLITGRFHWRPKLKDEIKDKVRGIGKSLYNSLSDGIDFWIKTVYSDSIDVLDEVWEKSKEYNINFFNDISELSILENDLDELRLFVNQSYESNDFYVKTVINFTLTILDELAIRDHIESLPKIFTEIWQAMGDSGKALRKSIVWLIETVKTTYNKLLDTISRFFHGESLQYLSGLLEKGVEKYDKFVKDLHISFIKYVETLWNKFWLTVANYWKSVLSRIEPHIFKFISYIEETAWDLSKEIFDYINQRTNELAESPYFNKVSSFTQDIDLLYRDIKSHDALTNIKKYATIAWNFLKDKYFKLVPFGVELNEVFTEIWSEIKELQKIEQMQIIIEKYNEIVAKLDWIAEELQLELRLHQLYALLHNKFRHYTMNALETADMYREAKTKFIFDPDVGIIDLEQKLPMSWHAFNETPKFEEIPEYKLLAQAQDLFASTNSSIIRYLYNLRNHLDPKTWLPPYSSHALLIDSRHYMTFDKRFIGLNLQFEEKTGSRRNSQCSYLLAHDFFRHNFSLLLDPSATASQTDVVSTRKLTFIANGQLLEIDLGNDSICINGNCKPMLPQQLGTVLVYREMDVLTIQSGNDFSLSCNTQFDFCWLEISGWYFGQTAGILGTMNNEVYDEYMLPTYQIAKDPEDFTNSWSLQQCKQKKSLAKPELTEKVTDVCNNFFRSGVLASCADTIDPKPFMDICLDLGINSNSIKQNHPAIKGACTAALAYIEACAAEKVPVRVPKECVFCQLSNGSYVPEGTFVELDGNTVPRSSDVVFLVEAKPCNANLTASKNLMTVLASIEDQLAANRITNNRYAVMAFGGLAPFEKPVSIIYENQVFTNKYKDLEKYFAHIEMHNVSHNSNNDILHAISTAFRLNYRPGVSKTFILLSCSDCAARYMRFDYTSILQYMREEGVNLHILADTEFDFERTRKLRHFFGLDHDMVYSKRFPEGDIETRQQLHIPKHNLGICTPLAMETGGSIFSARKLTPERRYPIKRLAMIFAKRVAKSAIPNANQTCECSGHNTGIAYMACSPSLYPEEKLDLDDYGSDFSDWEFDDDDYNKSDD